MRNLMFAVGFVALIMCVAVAVPARAAGGIYFDDFLITNNSATVFTDNFNDGAISDWQWTNDASVSSQHSYSSSDSLYLNWHGASVSCAYHSISITQPGVVEASAMVMLPGVQGQYCRNYNTSTFTNIVLYSRNTSDNLFAGMEFVPGEAGYRIYMAWHNYSGGPGAQATTASVVLTPGTWGELKLRLDTASNMAYALFNDQQLLSFSYNSQNFQSIGTTSVWGWLGDGALIPEPSSMLALVSGLAGLCAVYRRRSK